MFQSVPQLCKDNDQKPVNFFGVTLNNIYLILGNINNIKSNLGHSKVSFDSNFGTVAIFLLFLYRYIGLLLWQYGEDNLARR